jgi:capsular exopolysaccharide synthesis family protein
MEGEIDIRKYIRIFLRRKWIFLGIFCGILLGTWIKTNLTPKTFVASSKVLIKRTSTLIGESKILEEAFGIETNCEILKSRSFMEKVVNYMKEKGLDIDFLNSKDAPDILLEKIRVVPLRKADIIEITAYASTAEEVAHIANCIAETFKKYSVEIARAKVTEKRKFIESQLPDAEARLKESERDIQKFKEEEGLISVSAGGNALQRQLIELQGEYSALVAQISAKEDVIKGLKEELMEENKRLAQEIVKMDNSSLLNLRAQLLTLGDKYSAYVVAGLSEDHPKLIELNKKIEALKQKLKEKAKNRSSEEILLVDPLFFVKELSKKILDERAELRSLKSMKESMEKRIKEYTTRVRNFPQKEYELARLERKYKFNESLYHRLIEQYEETKITEVSEIGNVVITEEAIPPEKPISPNPTRNMLLALVFGLGFGIGCVFLSEYLDTTVKEIEEITKLGIPLTGTIPMVPKLKQEESIVKNPMSGITEAYKKLRLNLKFAGTHFFEDGTKSLLVSSCRPEEGKSTIALNLGATYAKGGLETILIEGDLRKPSLNSMLNFSSKKGLSNLLAGEIKKKEEVIFPTEIEKLWVIPAGYLPPNPGELIDSDNMRALISELKKEFKMIIIDSPPLVSCTDGFSLGNMADGVILVLEMGGTPRDFLLQAVSSFKETKTNFLGVVVNKMKEKRHYGYYHYYHYYGAK